jgi:C1A family cysteine protease
VRDQEQIGSCTGFCGTEANEILRYYANGSSFGPVLSPLYLYYIERVKIQKQKITVDNGAQMVDIPEALQGYGESIETDYAYPTNPTNTATKSAAAYKTAPSAAAVSNALLYEIGAAKTNYGMVAQGDTATVKALLRSNIPVCMGFNVYDNSGYTIFEGLNTTNYTYSPLTSTGALKSGLSLLGGHANIIYGYDDTKGVFLMENSWNTTWGKSGYWYLPYSVFMSAKIVPTGNVYWMTL